MDLLAAGRDADVFAYGEGLVLRRYRNGRPAVTEADLMRAVHALDYPVPAVVSVSGPDIVMERVDGPNLGEAMLTTLPLADGARLLARLHDDLHALPWPGAQPLLHLDLHPLNVILGPAGQVVIDWANARPGPPGLDIAMTALILAQTAIAPTLLEQVGLRVGSTAPFLYDLLAAFGSSVSMSYRDHLVEAERLRQRDPTQTDAERVRLPEAVALARSVPTPGNDQ